MTSATTTIEISAPERYAFVDLTEELERAIKDSGVTDGSVVAFCAHTTCALIINEWDDGALEDFRARMLRLVPDDLYTRTTTRLGAPRTSTSPTSAATAPRTSRRCCSRPLPTRSPWRAGRRCSDAGSA